MDEIKYICISLEWMIKTNVCKGLFSGLHIAPLENNHIVTSRREKLLFPYNRCWSHYVARRICTTCENELAKIYVNWQRTEYCVL